MRHGVEGFMIRKEHDLYKKWIGEREHLEVVEKRNQSA